MAVRRRRELAHLYVPGGDSATLTILGVAASGKLTVLGSVASAQDAHCVATDDAGHAYVCAPSQGAVLVVNDPFPASRRAAVRVRFSLDGRSSSRNASSARAARANPQEEPPR